MVKSKEVIAAATVVAAFGGVAASGVASAKTGKPAKASKPAKKKTTAVKGTKADHGAGYFAIVHSVGGTQMAAGIVKDKVLGTDAVTYQINLAPGATGTVNVKAKTVTIYTGTGTLTGTATATIVVAGSTATITNGKLDLIKGAGSLKGKKLIATFNGTANTTANQYQFVYNGTIS